MTQQGSEWFESEAICAVADLPTFVTPQVTQVTGTNPLCTDGIFQISTCKPVNPANITWSASPQGIVDVQGNGTQATVTKIGSGTVTITATVNFCNGTRVSGSKTMPVGGPLVDISYSQVGQCNGDYQTWYLNATSPNTVSSWYWSVDNPSSGSWYIDQPYSPNTYVDVSGGGGISVTATNSCGTTRNGVTIYSNCYYFAITATPNPTTGNVTIAVAQPKDLKYENKNKSLIHEIRVTDQMGNVKRQYKYSGVSNAMISLHGLMNGMYTIQAFDGTTWSSVKVLKQ